MTEMKLTPGAIHKLKNSIGNDVTGLAYSISNGLGTIAHDPRYSGLKIYIAGPMSGIPHFNFPAFYAAQALLESHGHSVCNPAERDKARHGGIDISENNPTGDQETAAREFGFSLRDALAEDTAYICLEANAIAMLPGWEESKGARAEHALAHALGHKVIYLGGFYG